MYANICYICFCKIVFSQNNPFHLVCVCMKHCGYNYFIVNHNKLILQHYVFLCTPFHMNGRYL